MHYRLKPIEEQTIVITGGTSGIGLCTALSAARRGARVVIVSRNEETLREVVQRIADEGGTADYIVADVGERSEVQDAVNEIVSRHGGFDTWVNNAGVGLYGLLEDTTDADHHKLFRTNYWGVVHGSLEALKHLKAKGGALINVGSISSDMPSPILSAYTASKHAVKGFTDSLRMELIHEGAPVSVTLIKPSGIHTPFGDHAPNYMDARSKVPSPVYHPQLVADAILHAAQHAVRDVLIGESGYFQTRFARYLPSLADRFLSAAMFMTALDRDRPPQKARGLHESGSTGAMFGEQEDRMMEFSPLTRAQLNPALSLALVVGAGFAAAGAVALYRNGRNGSGRL